MTDEYIGFRINAETKEKWQEAANENAEYRSLTHLITVAVESELGESEDASASASQSVDVDLSRLHDRFDRLEGQLDDIEDRVDETFILVDRERSDKVMEIAGRVLDFVPEVDDPEELLERDPERYDNPEERVKYTGKVSAIAEILMNEDYRDFEIKQAVETVEREMETVEMRDATPREDTTDKRIYRLPE